MKKLPHFSDMLSGKEEAAMQSDTGIVMAAIDYIEAHLSEKLDLETVAEEVHYSKYYLHRIFKCTLGRTIHDYIQRRQLTEAANLLAF